MPTEREACGLGAFLPVSCRGRAESFARRLHTRLRSLGGGAGGSTDLLRGMDDDEEGLDLACAMEGWGARGEGDGEMETQAGDCEVPGGSRGAEGGCGAKYRSTDRGVPGTVTVQQPHPTAGPAGHSPSPTSGSSPPFSSSPRPRLDSGLESLGSPNSGTPPRPGSNGSESGVAGINTPANGYFSPPNDAGFSSGTWHPSPSPERDNNSRSPYQRVNRRRREAKWPPAHQVEPLLGDGEAPLPNFLECYPQAGVDSPPETSWSPSSMSPENGVGAGMRFVSSGGGDELDGRGGAEYWSPYSYYRHGHPARSPATPPLLQSPDLSFPINSKGINSPTSYTPPCSPMSPAETNFESHNCSGNSLGKSPISEVEEEGEVEDVKEVSSSEEVSATQEEIVPVENHEAVVTENSKEVTNGHGPEDSSEVEEIEEIHNPSFDPPRTTILEANVLSFNLKLMRISSVDIQEESKPAEEEIVVEEVKDDEPQAAVAGAIENEKSETFAGEEEDVLSEDSMERDIQSLAETIYGKGAGVEGIDDTEDEREVSVVRPTGEGDCSPEVETVDEAELRKKYLDADSSDMDLKAVRMICEEMASRARKGESDVIIFSVVDEEGKAKEESEKQQSEDETERRVVERHEEVEEEEERHERTPRVRRSTSLKTGKTPPGTPSRKKIVRFADVLGLDLADVRTFLDEIPYVPRSAFQDLAPESSFEPVAVAAHWEIGSTTRVVASARRPRRYHLTPLFPQPGAAADFMDRVRERFVCLESAVEEDVDDEEDDGSDFFGVNCWSLLGTVRVRNLAFHKSVHARASADGWRSHADVPASFLPGSCDGFSDRFAFEIRPGIPPTGGSIGTAPFPRRIPSGGRLEFAVRFQCQGSQYWDNNMGANYVFSVEPLLNPDGSSSKSKEEDKPPKTPANPRSQTQAFQYLSLPSPDSGWASFL
ncbi:hypothetical protein J437_LFUL011567 [Ladona fulva]|uniref:CBM21 domain-containing protein n=1 Tax=Ladona fulva TaxID=123851 RepID=A0A8K0KAQ6_LADFU|nr:hypothetical protein J437_LFUL011567 [Ladona fulva]